MDLKDYITIYDDVLDENVCKNAIEFFNEDPGIVTRFDAKMCGFSSINLTEQCEVCLLYTSPSPRDRQKSRMPSSA